MAASAVAANAMMVAVAGIVAVRPFVGRPQSPSRAVHDPPWPMWLGPITLAALGLIFGLVPPAVGQGIVQPAVSAVLGAPETVKLALWHGINLPLLLSILTLAAGLFIYARHLRLRAWLGAAMARLPMTGDRGYEWTLSSVIRLAKAQTAVLQNGTLRRYMLVVFATMALGAGGTLLAKDAVRWPAEWPSLPLHEWGVVMLVAAGALLPVFARSRLAAICGLGVVGSGVALIFLFYGAPDVAITQLLVEVLFLAIMAVILLKLPPVRRPNPIPGAAAPGAMSLLPRAAVGPSHC